MTLPWAAGLTEGECSDVLHAMLDVPGGWSVERDRDDRGCTSLAILSAEEDGMAFLLWREDGLLHLGCGSGDFYAGLGSHPCVGGAIRAVRAAVDRAEAVRRQAGWGGAAGLSPARTDPGRAPGPRCPAPSGGASPHRRTVR